MQPETRYAKSGDVHIAYQVVGDGPRDIVHVPPHVSHLDYAWQEPGLARYYRRLASLGRLILLDKRGTGLSDRVEVGTLEERMDDIRAVMDAVGSDRAVVIGSSEAGPLGATFAATYPERTSSLILYGTFASQRWAPDYTWRPTFEAEQRRLAAYAETIGETWGQPLSLARFAPSRVHDERFAQWWTTYLRMAASPSAAVALMRMNIEIDVRHVLPAIRVPTLVLYRTGDVTQFIQDSQYIARHIQGAKFVELPGNDHLAWVGDVDPLLDEIEEFLTGSRPGADPERVLATVLFTDIVGSTAHASTLGDRRWRELLDDHHIMVRHELTRFRGREIHTTGDGFLATFDGPARAARCAVAITQVVRSLGLEVRAGVHTGEIEVMGDDIGGIAVHTGARVAAEAGPGEVLASSTVKDLVAGSGIEFDDRGVHTLRGVPGEWRLFRVIA